MVTEKFEAERKFTADCVDYEPTQDMTFNEVFDHINAHIFSDMRGYKKLLVTTIFSNEQHSNYHLRAFSNSDDPSYFYQAVLFGCTENLWLPCPPNDELLERYPNSKQAQALSDLKEKLYDTQCGDFEAIENICVEMHYAYCDFLVEASEEIFSTSVHDQMLWIREVNAFEDWIGLEYKPLSIMPAGRFQTLFENSRDARKALIAKAELVDFDTYKAIKAVDELIEHCVTAFRDGLEIEGLGYFRAIHPGALDNWIDELSHDASLLDTTFTPSE